MGVDRVLVTGLGLGNYSPVRYRVVGQEQVVETRFVPVALVKSLGLAGSTCVVLLTPQARERSFPELQAELERAGTQTCPVDIPMVRDTGDAVEVLLRLQSEVPARGEVFLDITHSFRHLPVVALGALTYLTSLRDVRLSAIYYGAHEVPDEVKPIIDLSAVFRLMEWYHAVRSALEAGDYKAFVKLFRQTVGDVWRSSPGTVSLENGLLTELSSTLERLERDLAVGLPLEAGLDARRFLDRLARRDRSGVRQASPVLKAAALALEPFRDHLRHLASAEVVKDKKRLPLDLEELRRELHVSRWYVESNQFQKALIILREILVNLVVLCLAGSGRLPGGQWLDPQTRASAEEVLSALRARTQAGITLSGHEQALAQVWQAISDRRNELAHGGFSPRDVAVSPERYSQLLKEVQALLAHGALLSVRPPRQLLVAALGRSPGSLFTALRHVRPDELVLVASQETIARLPEVLERAGFPGLPVRDLVVEDGLRDFRAVPELVEGLGETLGAAGRVVVCLTGGSTLLQYAVELVAHRARSLGAAVQAVATVDIRLPEDQRTDPYRMGEVYDVPWPSWASGTGDDVEGAYSADT